MNGNPVRILLIILALVVFFVGIVPKLESNAEKNFNNTFRNVDKNTEIVISKTNMSIPETEVYINSTCEIIFGNGNYRSGDALLCKQRLRDKYGLYKIK